jgi:hypothetical protein
MRRLLLSFVLAAPLSALGASSALAQAPEGAQKAPLYGPEIGNGGFSCEAGAFPTPKKFGFVVLDTPGNEATVSVEIALKRAAPNTEYSVFVAQNITIGCFVIFPSSNITTNKKGNGNLHFTVERAPTANKFSVGLTSTSNGLESIDSSSVELD